MDKAGGHGVQDGYGLVEEVDGSYYNVMGLDIDLIQRMLEKLEK